jgi:hypothetical protein
MKKTLTTEQQAFIVQQLACYKTPSDVVEAVKEEFGITINRQTVRHYNPEQSPEVAAQWKKLFDETRAEFRAKAAEIGIASQAYRLSELQEMQQRAKAVRNYPLAVQIIDQAAKEVGAYTHKQEIKLDGQVTTMTMTVDEWKKQAAERRRQAEETIAMFEDEPEAGPLALPGAPAAIPMVAVESSNIASIGYDVSSKTLAVQFLSSGLYHISPVEPARFAAFYSAPSKGRFYNDNFKDGAGLTITKMPAAERS